MLIAKREKVLEKTCMSESKSNSQYDTSHAVGASTTVVTAEISALREVN